MGQLMGALSGNQIIKSSFLTTHHIYPPPGKQELSVQNVVSMVQSGGGEALVEHAQTRGLDPALVNGVMGIIRSVQTSADHL